MSENSDEITIRLWEPINERYRPVEGEQNRHARTLDPSLLLTLTRSLTESFSPHEWRPANRLKGLKNRRHLTWAIRLLWVSMRGTAKTGEQWRLPKNYRERLRAAGVDPHKIVVVNQVEWRAACEQLAKTGTFVPNFCVVRKPVRSVSERVEAKEQAKLETTIDRRFATDIRERLRIE
jgi:hypothetical protein